MNALPEFKSYSSIDNIKKLWMTVTQKIHGTNAQILIEYPNDDTNAKPCILAGSRTRWLTIDDDNYGFCKWVMENRDALIAKLGVGRHYGEWCGKGINNGEGLSDKMFVLFDWWNYADAMKGEENVSTYPYLMPGVRVVPVLFKGHYSDSKLEEIMDDLKTNGSKLTPAGWWMKPEGIVIDINGTKYKKVFEQEETAWAKSDKPKIERVSIDVSHLLQPIRLEKIISRDESYSRQYPDSLRDIVGAYITDLVKDEQIPPFEDKNLRKALCNALFPFVKHFMEST